MIQTTITFHQKKIRNEKKKHFIDDRICAALDRYKISDRAAVHVLIPVITALGHDPNDFVVNRKTIQNSLSTNRLRCAERMKEDFKVNNFTSYGQI